MATIKIHAGMTVELGNTANPVVFTELLGVIEIGEVGEESSPIDITTLKDTTKKYIHGMKDTPEIEIKFHRDKDDTVQNDFKTAAQVGETRQLKITWSNGESATVTLALLGYKFEAPENDKVITAVVKAKQSGETVWG